MKNFLKIVNYTEDKDFTSYTLNYPPLAVWSKIKNENTIINYWKSSLKIQSRIGLYIHVPFCKTKCHYCRFFSKELKNENEINVFLNALSLEAKIFKPIFEKSKFRTVYIGGGSPSILGYDQLENLFMIIFSHFQFIKNKHVTFEANPSFLDLTKLKILKEFGVNRLTIGVQTLNKGLIKKINRTQTAKSVFLSYELARKIGIEFINMDLMCGLPSQTIKSFIKDLLRIVYLKPDIIHISRFMPTAFVGFAKQGKEISIREKKLAQKMERFATIILLKFNYRTLEFDSWAKSEKAQNFQLAESKRDHASFLGLGPGAVSRASGVYRYVNSPFLKDYVKKIHKKFPAVHLGYKMTKEDCMRDFILCNLWYAKISRKKFYNFFKEPLEKRFGPTLKKLIINGYLNTDGNYYFTKMNPPAKDCFMILRESFFRKTHIKKITNLLGKSKYCVQ